MDYGIYDEPVTILHFEPTTNCNARCPQCVRNIIGTPHTSPFLKIGEWNPEQLNVFLDDPFLSSLEGVLVNGNDGDIVMHTQPQRLLQVFFDRNLKIKIHTNGGGQPTSFWQWLGTQKDVVVEFALDGLEDTHHLYRRNTRYDVVIKNAKAYIEAGGSAIWVFTMFKHNQHQLETCKQLSEQYGFDGFKSRPSTRFLFEKQVVYDKDYNIEYYLEPADLVKNKIKLLPGDGSQYDPRDYDQHIKQESYFSKDADYKQINCIVKRTKSIYVSGNMKLYPCCWIGNGKYIKDLLLPEDFNDISKYSIEDVLSTGYFDMIEESWQTKNVHTPCATHCTKHSNKQIKDDNTKRH